jgi:hypothetical protein
LIFLCKFFALDQILRLRWVFFQSIHQLSWIKFWTSWNCKLKRNYKCW